MEKKETSGIREKLLRWLHISVFILSLISLVLVLWVNPAGSYERRAYSFLIIALLILIIVASILRTAGHYRLSALITVAAAVIGPWGSFFLDPAVGVTDFFPLVYISISVMLASLFMSLLSTILLASAQFVGIILILLSSPATSAINWPSFTAYILFVSVLSIAANYIGKHQLNQLQEHAIRDHLTGLFNRRYFDATIEHEISRAQNKETQLGVILMDIDAFKKYNDNFGHDAGDLLLQTIGTFVLDEIRLSDIVCRYGGDEFAILIPNADRKTISELAERLRIEAKQIDITYEGKPLGSISISQGIAVFPENGTTRDELMTHADAALFRAKEGGRDAISN